MVCKTYMRCIHQNSTMCMATLTCHLTCARTLLVGTFFCCRVYKKHDRALQTCNHKPMAMWQRLLMLTACIVRMLSTCRVWRWMRLCSVMLHLYQDTQCYAVNLLHMYMYNHLSWLHTVTRYKWQSLYASCVMYSCSVLVGRCRVTSRHTAHSRDWCAFRRETSVSYDTNLQSAPVIPVRAPFISCHNFRTPPREDAYHEASGSSKTCHCRSPWTDKIFRSAHSSSASHWPGIVQTWSGHQTRVKRCTRVCVCETHIFSFRNHGRITQ